MNKISIYRNCLIGALLAAACAASLAEQKQVKGTGVSSLRARSCSISIEITRDNRDIVRTRMDGHPTGIFEIRNGDTASLRRHIQQSCESGKGPSVSIHVAPNEPFQSLVNVIAEMVPAKIARFDVLTGERRIMMRIPGGRPRPEQSEIHLNITAQGTFSVNDARIFQPLDSRDLSRSLLDRMSSKTCCFVIINADAKAPVKAFMDALAAIQLAAIDDYWVSTRSGASASQVDQRKALEKRILDLEDEQKRLLREVRKQTSY
jgi:biopolymer transport protein ExbD